MPLQIKVAWAKSFLKCHSIQVKRGGSFLGDPRELRGVIFVANHQSIVDIPVSMSQLPLETSFVAKKELRKFPIFGYTAKLVGTLFIDRAKGTRNAALDGIESHLRCGGCVLLFPEGTRSVDGKLLPFKRGAFVMAIQNQVPVVPVTIRGTRTICPKKRLSIGSGEVEIFVEEPILTKGLQDSDRYTLADRVYSMMSERNLLDPIA